MITKKKLIVAVLATFCVTFALFAVVPTRSANLPVYDPWLDTNDDGRINMRDIGDVVSAFGAEAANGTSTKNVTVTNWPQGWKAGEVGVINVSWAYDNMGVGFGVHIPTEGYSRMYVSIVLYNMSRAGDWSPNVTTIWLSGVFWRNLDYNMYNFEDLPNCTCTIAISG